MMGSTFASACPSPSPVAICHSIHTPTFLSLPFMYINPYSLSHRPSRSRPSSTDRDTDILSDVRADGRKTSGPESLGDDEPMARSAIPPLRPCVDIRVE